MGGDGALLAKVAASAGVAEHEGREAEGDRGSGRKSADGVAKDGQGRVFPAERPSSYGALFGAPSCPTLPMTCDRMPAVAE